MVVAEKGDGPYWEKASHFLVFLPWGQFLILATRVCVSSDFLITFHLSSKLHRFCSSPSYSISPLHSILSYLKERNATLKYKYIISSNQNKQVFTRFWPLALHHAVDVSAAPLALHCAVDISVDSCPPLWKTRYVVKSIRVLSARCGHFRW